MTNDRAFLLVSCPDKVGLVLKLAQFISTYNGNIIDLDEHVDEDEHHFYARIAWDMNGFALSREELEMVIHPLMREFQAHWELHFSSTPVRVALFVSKYDHCLQEVLWRHQMKEFPIEIPLIVSNHPDLKPLADQHEIPYHVFPITKETKAAQEAKELALLAEYGITTVVLARYMQIITSDFIDKFAHPIINIHHSFLPAFIGGSPYKQAFERGVKIIGATSHYVTPEIDAGPIIEQDIIRITHKDSVDDLVRKGRDLERLVLARALRFHAEHRVLVRNNKTVIFE